MAFGSCYFFIDNIVQNMKIGSVEINGFQKGLLVNFEYIQTFINEENDQKEIYYAFYNDFKTCIYDITFVIGDEIIKPKIQPKEKLNTSYNDSSNSTFYSSSTDQKLIQFKIGNIQPKITCKAILKLAFIGQQIKEKLFFIKIPDDAYTSSESRNFFDVDTSNFLFRLQCDKENINKVTSNVKTAIFDENSKIFSIQNKIEKNDNESSIIIIFETKDRIITSLTHAPIDQINNNSCALTISPNLPILTNETSFEFIFVIDCSGSIYSNSIEKASECLQIFVKSLPINSYFNVIRFGSKHEKLFEESVPYNDQNVEKAINMAQTLRADLCGSKIYSVFEDIYKEENQHGQKQIFILTDGLIEDIEQVLGFVSSHLNKNRCFTVGIDEGSDFDFIEKIAQMTGGKSDFVQDGDSISEIVIPLLQASLYPLMPIHIHTKNDDDLFEVSPYPLPLIGPKDSTVIFLREKARENQNKVFITGSFGEDLIEVPIEKVEQLVNVKEDRYGCSKGLNIGDCIIPLFAFHQLQKIERKKIISDEEKSKAVELSISNGILCKYTEFVGTTENPNQQIDFETMKILLEDHQMLNYINENLDFKSSEAHKASSTKETISNWFRNFFGSLFGRNDDSKKDMSQPAKDQESSISPPNSEDNSNLPAKYNLVNIIRFQKVDGHWEDLKAVQSLTGFNIDHIEEIHLFNKNDENKCVATIIAIAFIRVKLRSEINSWFLIEAKALKWLKKILDEKFDIENIISSISSLF